MGYVRRMACDAIFGRNIKLLGGDVSSRGLRGWIGFGDRELSWGGR